MAREGKIHLVESYSGPRSAYKNVTNEAKYESLKEAAKELHKGKNRLTEASTMDKMKKVLVENKIDKEIQERVLKGLQEAGANPDDVEIWQFPVSKINDAQHKNLNNRVYNRKLWENVVNNQADVWKGGTGLANHPADDEDGDFMLQSIVWLDGFIGDDGIIYGIGTFVGDGGDLARQIISVGGKVGFSTSGYGDFLADGFTVDPDGYEIDRFADLVLNPSQGVFGDYRDSYKATNESVKKENNVINESVNKKLNESENKKFSIKVKGEEEKKEFESFDDFKAELKKHLKDANEDFEDLDVGEYKDSYQGSESEKFKDIESTEVPELDEDVTLSEKLIVDYYTEAIKKINKDSNRLYEKKITKLESLVKKLKKESLNESSKNKINSQISKMVESIEKDVKKAMAEGFDARDLCEELEISSLSKLSNIKEKIEDFSSLEDCLIKAKKEAKRYKEMYEAKVEGSIQEAKNSTAAGETIKSLKEKISELETNLKESKKENKGLSKKITEAGEKNDSLTEQNEKKSSVVDLLREKLKSTKETLKITISEKEEQAEVISKLQEEVKSLQAENRKKSLATKAGTVSNKISEQRAQERIKVLSEKMEKILESNRNLKELVSESEKTIDSLKKSLGEAKTSLREKTSKINSLQEKLALKDESETNLRANLKKARSRFESLNEDYENTSEELADLKEAHKKEVQAKELARKEAKSLAAKNRKLFEEKSKAVKEAEDERIEKLKAERIARKNSKSINEDFTETFVDTDAIEDYYDQFEDGIDFEGMDNVRTLKDAQNASLFSNELFSDDAEEERANLRRPGAMDMTLADMFN